MSSLAASNDSYKFIITIIDTFSKMAWAFGLKNKSATSIVQVMTPFLTENRCQKLEFDQGTEFYNGKFLALLKKLKIKHYSIYSDRKCAIVERYDGMLFEFFPRGAR